MSLVEHYRKHGLPSLQEDWSLGVNPFYLNCTVKDVEGLREELENEEAMLERDLLDIANRKLRIASLKQQLGD